MSDRHDSKRPWILSPGMFGNWSPFAAAGRAARRRRQSREIDSPRTTGSAVRKRKKAASESVPAAGAIPGRSLSNTAAGPTDDKTRRRTTSRRSGPRKPLSTATTLPTARTAGAISGERVLGGLPDLPQQGYRFGDRIEQINRRNYRWAATAGGGLGKISGAVFTYAAPGAGPESKAFLRGTWNFTKRPVAEYSWADGRLFTKEGRLRGSVISRAVRSENCQPATGNRTPGTPGRSMPLPMTPTLRRASAVPTATPGREVQSRATPAPDRKGWNPAVAVRNDLDGRDMKTCAGCHYERKYKPSRPGMPAEAKDPQITHGREFPRGSFHFSLVACTGCHATERPPGGSCFWI